MIDARISVGLPSHPKTKKLIKKAGTDAAWRLVCLFLWVAQNHSDGNLDGLSSEDIELAVGGEIGQTNFLGSFIDSGWISFNGDSYVLDMSCVVPAKPLIERFGRICSKTWRKIRHAIFARDQWTCVYCGTKSGPFECDHIIPISKGGSNDRSNLATACRPCNRSKKDKMIHQWRAA